MLHVKVLGLEDERFKSMRQDRLNSQELHLKVFVLGNIECNNINYFLIKCTLNQISILVACDEKNFKLNFYF